MDGVPYVNCFAFLYSVAKIEHKNIVVKESLNYSMNNSMNYHFDFGLFSVASKTFVPLKNEFWTQLLVKEGMIQGSDHQVLMPAVHQVSHFCFV